jgi:hypothetical protein
MASNAGGSRVSEILSEAEQDCQDHTFKVSVVHRPKKPVRRSKVIAGLLRVLAENTDGWCAFRGATDATLVTTGMIFSVTSDEKRDGFITRVANYLSTSVRQQISLTKI